MKNMKNESVFLKALKRKPTACTPVWFMRQAGRYMKEYRDIRSRVSFMEMCKSPEIVTEVTLQPVNKLGVDAAIIFADILLPLEGMGIPISFESNDGPVIIEPVETLKQIEKILPLQPEKHNSYLLKAIKLIKNELGNKIPLIGFCGAPFTLASYVIEGKHSRNFSKIKKFMFCKPAAFEKLMTKLTSALISYLNAQINAGVDTVQVFDSWVGILSPDDYEKYIKIHMKRLFNGINKNIPTIHFGTMNTTLLKLMKEAGGDAIGVDWRLPLDQAWKIIGEDRAIQGNLDPAVLLASWKEIEIRVKNILDRANGKAGHIFNLGHGIFPETPVDHVKRVVDFVHEYSQRKLCK